MVFKGILRLRGVGAGEPFTIGLAGPTPDSEPSQPSPHCMEHLSEPTADREPKPTATNEPSQERVIVLLIAPEPEPYRSSNQVREPAKMNEEIPAHCTTAGGELPPDSVDLIDFYSEIPSILPSSKLSAFPDTAKEAIF